MNQSEDNIIDLYLQKICHYCKSFSLRRQQALKLKIFEIIILITKLTKSIIIFSRWRAKLHSTDRQCFPGISLHTQLDRKALSSDYLPFFREIARSENTRHSFNSKRGNRFFHYFKGLGVHMNDSDLEILQKKLIFISKDEEENKMET